jgi:hypothetical protein
VHAPDFEVFRLQILGQHLAQFPVIVDQQHSRLVRTCRFRRGGGGGILGDVGHGLASLLWHIRRA